MLAHVGGRLASEKEIAAPLRISRAKRLVVADGYEGDIDELRVYDYPLGESEVAELHAREMRYEIGHWGFDRMEREGELPSDSGYTALAEKVTLAGEASGAGRFASTVRATSRSPRP